MTLHAEQSRAPQILLTSAGRAWRGLQASFLLFPRGLAEAPGSDLHGVGLHYGPPVNASCHCGGRRQRRVQQSGDIDIIPAGVDGTWEDDADCHILHLGLQPMVLNQVAAELGRKAGAIELQPRLQVRDARIEGIGWAIKADLESDTPSDPLYIELLANALAVRLIELQSETSPVVTKHGEARLSVRQLRTLTEFIETNLGEKLHLADLANVAGIGITRLKALFRNSTGIPVHQYVIRRRVEFARAMMITTSMPASEIAVAAGFAHQSHMTSTMRRLLGQTPTEILRHAGHLRPNLPSPD